MVNAKYDTIGINYNQTRKADRYITARLLHYLRPESGGLYLDIGCGTGNYTSALHQKEYQLIGIDPSKEMLDKARKKNNSIDWRTGQAEKTGLQPETIDGILATLTLHHWKSLEQGFKELYRVLKPHGKIVIFTSTPKQMKNYWLNHYFPKMLNDSMQQMPSYEDVSSIMKNAGFKIVNTEKYFVKPNLEDLFLQSGKYNPELYFKPEVRNGISSFAALANKNEVDTGLKKLRVAIDNNKINSIIRSYESNAGDYLFIIGQKNKAGLN